MALIGMGEAGRRLGVTSNSARRALQNANVPLVKISDRVHAIEETDLEAFVKKRGESPGTGRPKGAKNKPKDEKPPP